MNKQGEKPLSLQEDGAPKKQERPVDLLENESLTRFDKNKKKRKPKNRNGRPAQKGRGKQTDVQAKKGDGGAPSGKDVKA